MSAPDSYDICRKCYTRLGEGDDQDIENGALCPECKRDPLTPVTAVLIKLGSIAVHVEEMLSPDGHIFDRDAIDSLLQDPELIAWREQMDKMAFLPKKRKP